MSDEREYITALTMQEDGCITLEFNTLGKSAVREEVVRCRDCRFCGKGYWGVEAFPVCRRGIHAFQVSNDGFCKWGERRDA